MSNSDNLGKEKMFIDLPNQIRKYYLDTSIWGNLAKSESERNNFILFFGNSNNLACLSPYTIMELSRASHIHDKLDSIFYSLRFQIWVPELYDWILDSEISSYPDPVQIKWMPLSLIMDEKQPKVISILGGDARIARVTNDHLEFGRKKFMSLEDFKKNFEPSDQGIYTTEQAEFFSWCNTVDFLGREFPAFLVRFKDNASELDVKKLPSLYARSLFLFYKYYIYGQSPGKSDLFDFAHISYSPYVDFYVTENNVSNAIKHIKLNGHLFKKTQIMNASEFSKELEN